MDTTRFLLVTSLFVVIMLLWQAWVTDYGLQPASTEVANEAPSKVEGLPELPQTTENKPATPAVISDVSAPVVDISSRPSYITVVNRSI